MKKLATALFLLLSAALIVGCKDASIPASLKAVHNENKAANTDNRLPESDFKTAVSNHGFAELISWAENGDMKAQHFVAVAYLDGGVGVPKDFKAAEKWALRAANQGSPSSQYLMGMIRADAVKEARLSDIELNAVRAYMWFSLSAAQGNTVAREARDAQQSIIGSKLVERAQALAAAWRPCHEFACQDSEPSN